MDIEVKVLGTPNVKLNGEIIDFPYKKVEALLYYLMIEKKVSRIKAACLLWGGMPDKKAKKNLRNALYQLKKIVGKNLIKTPDRSTILINEEDYNVFLDLDVFLSQEDKEAIEIYDSEFLSGFLIKETLEFENWVFKNRNYYRQLYIKKLKKHIKFLKENKNFREAIYFLKMLTEVDPFDERVYRELMELYSKQGAIAKAISVYKRLEEQLENELGITPDDETINLLQSIKEDMLALKNNNKLDQNKFIGRDKELKMLINNLYKFVNNKSCYSCLVFGEAGIGKTTLINQALSSVKLEETIVLKADCFQAEKRYSFKPWKNILKKLKNKINFDNFDIPSSWKKIVSTFFPSFLMDDKESLSTEILNFESLEYQSFIDVLLTILVEVSKRKKLILVFEDLQWCDEKSLILIKQLIKESKNNNILVLVTSRNENKSRIENNFLVLKRYNYIKEIKLSRLDFSEVKYFVHKTLPNHHFSEGMLNKVYEESEGNTFFLVEMLNLLAENKKGEALSNLLTTKSKDILRNRVLSVSSEAQKLLKLISVCFHEVSYELLSNISEKSDIELIEILEELQDYYLLKESYDKNRLSYQFTHSKIREFIYKKLSFSRRNLLHRRIAQFLENKIQRINYNCDNYAKLIYHYSQSGDKLKQLNYLIKEAEVYFHQTHDLFPVISDRRLEKDQILYFKQKEASFYLSEIKKLLREIEQQLGRTLKMRQMEVRFLNMKIKFLICQGDYNSVISHIKKMIFQAKSLKDWSSVLEGYQQMASLGVQKEDINLISDNARNMYDLAREIKSDVKQGVALRFLGIVQLYRNNYKKAEKIFNQALEIFIEAETLGKKYTLSIAAVYNYLGEVKRHQKQLKEAIKCYNLGIELCQQKNIIRGLGVFYTNAGQAFLELNNYKQARINFKKALDNFKQLNIIWGYSAIANGFMALISIWNNNYNQAYDYLKTADSIIDQHHKRYWLGILFRIKAEIVYKMTQNKKLQENFKGYLVSESRNYQKYALDIFREVGAPYEVKFMENFGK